MGHQLLFLVPLFAALFSGFVFADKLILKNGRVEEGEILGVVEGSTIQIKVEQGTIGRRIRDVASVEMVPPEKLKLSKALLEEGKLGEALGALRPLAEKYRGLPTPWAQDALVTLADIYLALEKNKEAEKVYRQLAESYPAAASGGISDVGMAKLAFSEGKYEEARQKLQPLVEAALKNKSATRQEAIAYGRAFLVLGQLDEAEENYPRALENYLRTVTIYPQDAVAMRQAQERADALRSRTTVAVP